MAKFAEQSLHSGTMRRENGKATTGYVVYDLLLNETVFPFPRFEISLLSCSRSRYCLVGLMNGVIYCTSVPTYCIDAHTFCRHHKIMQNVITAKCGRYLILKVFGANAACFSSRICLSTTQRMKGFSNLNVAR